MLYNIFSKSNLNSFLDSKTFLYFVNGGGLKIKNANNSDQPLFITRKLMVDSVPFSLTVEKTADSSNLPISKSVISRSYYNLTIGESLYQPTIKKVKNNGFIIVKQSLGNGIQMFSCVKKFRWNGITWDELDLYFKDNKLIGIAFAIVCNSEIKAKHYLERVSNIYREKYKDVITDSSPDFLYFDDGETAMEVYGADITMYLRICETSVAGDL